MPRLGGVSLGVKLIVTTTLLITLLVILTGYLNQVELRNAHTELGRSQQALRLEHLRAKVRADAGTMAASVGVALSGNDYSALQSLVLASVEADPGLLWGRILDPEGRVLADSDRAVAKLLRTGDHVRYVRRPPGVSLVFECPEGLVGCERGQLAPEALLEAPPGAVSIEVTAPISLEGQALGQVQFGASTDPLRADLLQARDDIRAELARSLERSLVFGGLAVLLGSLIAVFQGLRITRPLVNLAHHADRISQGDFSARAPIETGDEIGRLSRHFNRMTERLEGVLADTALQAGLEKEMEVARAVQENLLPPEEVVRRGRLRFMGSFASASVCGGDFWTHADLAGDKVLIAVGDVTGHGVPSAMMTAAAKSCIDTLRHVTRDDLSVTYLMEEMNKTLFTAGRRRFVMTFFASVIDPAARSITFSNAGHNFPYLLTPNGSPGPPRIGVLVTRGNRLGDVWDSRFQTKTVALRPGSVIVWYTDGLTEAEDASGEMFGERRLRRVLQAVAHQEPDRILDAVRADFEGFRGDAPLLDDLTLVVGKID
jgi:serine phosphatase RsbU (regulator of sigma subunit)